MFAAADLVVIVNKIDLLPYVDFDLEGLAATAGRSTRASRAATVGDDR